MRTGSADLPLHGGHVPKWLADRMTALGTVLVEAIVIHYGPDEVLRRLAHPFWFQSLGAVMGMDWHSSGITTSVLGALKRGLAARQDELGIYVCGGRGRHSKKTPMELAQVGERTGLDGAALAKNSRMVAKVDSACVQDGFDLYLHGFFVARSGHWTVVQQGMNGDARMARRYHWLSEGLESFVDEPHAAIEGRPRGEIVNLVDARAARSREAQVELVKEGPERVVAELAKLRAPHGAGALASPPAQGALPFFAAPAHHHVSPKDVVMRRVHAAIAAAHERGPLDFEDVLATPGIGGRTLFSLAMVAEVLHGAPSRFSDPARFSLAHGGKDGHPYPVPLKVYDETIRVMKRAVASARLGNGERLLAMKRLDDATRRIDQTARLVGPTLDEFVDRERERSASYGGRTVFGDAAPAPALPSAADEAPSPGSDAIVAREVAARRARHHR
ncbi:MAG: DUF763 domain-containing protein [Deltaproteobacteria bacterium]|nr:DUF763 domain-containing protein [Deltaproteobacteria bacterium]